MRREATFPTLHGEGLVFVEDGLLVEVRLPQLGAAPTVGAWTTSSAGKDPSAGTTSSGSTTSFSATAEAPASGESKLDYAAEGDLSSEIAARWAHEFAAYFRGERRTWSPEEIGLERYGFTPFQTAVYQALLTVPPGAVVSYGELARLAGYPRAARAVGTVMATNPIAIVVPCHRVVRSDGSLGHYGFGDAWKPLLLSMEGSMT